MIWKHLKTLFIFFFESAQFAEQKVALLESINEMKVRVEFLEHWSYSDGYFSFNDNVRLLETNISFLYKF